MARKAQITPEQQKHLEDTVRRARVGDVEYRWLDKLVRGCGYVPLAKGRGDALPVTKQRLAEHFGVTVRAMSHWIREGMPQYRQGAGPQGTLFDMFEVAKWHEQRELERCEMDGGDPLLRGGTSEAMELYRREKYRQAKRENELAEGRVMEKSELVLELNAVASVFRRTAEAIEKRYGAEIGGAVRRMIEDAEAAWRKVVEK